MKFTGLLLILSLFLTSCSQFSISDQKIFRVPASNVEEISYYLSIDKFKYYINEYSISQEGKVPNGIIEFLRAIDVKKIHDMSLDIDALADAHKYDALIYDILKSEGLTYNLAQKDLVWGYNFFKNKLNEAFNLAPTKLSIALSMDSTNAPIDVGDEVKPIILSPEDMTLDSGHYISNRTTRAIFWDANENNRPIEFHLGDSREFLKELKEKNGQLLYEVKPFAKNYNKIYIIQYPGEKTYRYAITNIGGQDRLDHLTNQISLSNLSGKKLQTKVLVKGDIKKFHEARTQEHILQLQLLPKADRVIIGQKESIDGKFNIYWRIRALKNLYDQNPTSFTKKFVKPGDKNSQKLMDMIQGKANHEVIFKDKKIIEDAYASVQAQIEKDPKLLPPKFKVYNYDNFTIEMCDYLFEGNNGQTIRWRVVSNVWGDEIIPIAQAFKSTGHKNVTYMGTAGAFHTKGYKVGDLVSPSFVYDNEKKLPILSTPMKIEGAKYAGSVEHVGSPFEESHDWLKKAQQRSEFVEVETSYLRRIFNSTDDKLEIFLLISDILGSDTETLAHATSAKRKNSQNKLLAKLIERDSKGIPSPKAIVHASAFEKNRAIVFRLLEGKTAAYQYYIYSLVKNEKNLTDAHVLGLISKEPAFTDNFILDRLVKVSELIHQIKISNPTIGEFDIAFSKSLALGTWNPKTQKLAVTLKARNTQSLALLEAALKKHEKYIGTLKSFATIDAKMAIETSEQIWLRIPDKTDPDLLVKIYAHSGLKSAGLYKKVTYNGNMRLDFFPTSQAIDPLAPFFQGIPLKQTPSGTLGGSCLEAMETFLKIL